MCSKKLGIKGLLCLVIPVTSFQTVITITKKKLTQILIWRGEGMSNFNITERDFEDLWVKTRLVARRVVIFVHFRALATFPNSQPLPIEFRRSFRLSQNLKALEFQFCDYSIDIMLPSSHHE